MRARMRAGACACVHVCMRACLRARLRLSHGAVKLMCSIGRPRQSVGTHASRCAPRPVAACRRARQVHTSTLGTAPYAHLARRVRVRQLRAESAAGRSSTHVGARAGGVEAEETQNAGRGLAEHGLRTALGSVGGEPPKGTAALLHPRGASA
jgi:hypothetical protein